jgi:two-component system, cell cycle sensor histidine kinase and response regulator CckA
VIGNAELARMDLSKRGLPSERLEAILQESRRAVTLGRILLTSIGQRLHKFESLDLGEFIQSTLPWLRESLPAGRPLTMAQVATGLVVKGEPETLRQLFSHLVMNASEALPETGEILLSVGRIPCDRAYLQEPQADPDLPEGDYAYVDVSDNGSGMTAETLKAIYDPFFSTRFAGRGLGMAVALGIVKSHRGVIKINTLPGKGTTVRVLLPLRSPRAPLPGKS